MSVIQDKASEMLEQLMEKRTFSGKSKKVRINLIAMTRSEYSEEIEVPVEFGSDDLNELTAKSFREVDGCEFTDDAHYWEKGDCNFEEL